jgi:hypothetical protein
MLTVLRVWRALLDGPLGELDGIFQETYIYWESPSRDMKNGTITKELGDFDGIQGSRHKNDPKDMIFHKTGLAT